MCIIFEFKSSEDDVNHPKPFDTQVWNEEYCTALQSAFRDEGFHSFPKCSKPCKT